MQFRVGKFQAKVPSWLAPALGYAISIASLAWFLQGVDFNMVVQDFQALHWGWVAIAVVSDIAVQPERPEGLSAFTVR